MKIQDYSIKKKEKKKKNLEDSEMHSITLFNHSKSLRQKNQKS